ncbi:MAG: hypothetical protein ACLGRW_03755 [Acidobacteriota bacterium]|jgi:hypothetical protein
MKLSTQILIANAILLAGLAYKFFRGSPILHLVVGAIPLFAMVNLIFFVRGQRAKKVQ